ncbi:signal peptidase I [Halolamina pelagica]|uniref:Signal peptidase I n=1 Tax=Halolamina pelagica TaxID=699431 RepID=A0A0P7FX14_9EURY|nr:signal peptidase I [Halolamina pelagica]KPN31769.1 signal peptidase I [Halolamina pelagica]
MSRLDAISPRHVVGLLVLLLLVAPFAAYTVPGVVGADESYIVLTGSMRPAIDPGAVVFVSAVPTASIGVGDVVTFDRGGDVPTTHRVIEIVERDGDLLFRTQGDANEDPDVGLVGADQVIGVVTFSIPYVGSVMTAANSQYGFVALVVVPFALLVLDVGYSAVVGRREDAAVDAELPAIYDPVQAAEAYYDAAADRLREAEALAGTGGVTSRDMTASMLLAAGLTTYAAWNAYWQFDSFGAPRAETMSVLSGALVCLAFLGYLRVTADDPTPTADEATGVSGEPTGAPVGVQTATDGAPVDSPASPAANGRAITVEPPVRHAPSAAGNTPPAGVPQEEMHDAE